MKKIPELFNDVDSNINFGISRSYTDLMSKLKLLIREAKLRQEGAFFQVVGEIKTINNDIVRLEYEFEASSLEEAITIFDNYKTISKQKVINNGKNNKPKADNDGE